MEPDEKPKMYGDYTAIMCQLGEKDIIIRDELVKLIKSIDVETKPDWNTLQVHYVSYLELEDPVGPSYIGIKYSARKDD